jgi:AraC-like DNA-binding protein
MPVSFSGLHTAEPSPQARRLLWHVLSVGRVWRDEPEHHAGADKAGLHLFWVLHGSGTLETGGTPLALAPGRRCWLVDLRQARSYLPQDGKRLETVGFRFHGPALEAWREALGEDAAFIPDAAIRRARAAAMLGDLGLSAQQGLYQKDTALRSGKAQGPMIAADGVRPIAAFGFIFQEERDFAILQRAQRLLLKLARQRPADWEWRVHETINEVLGHLAQMRRLFQASPMKEPEPVRRVLEVVLAEPDRDWQAAALARIAGVSYSRLRDLFKASRAETLHDFLQRTRLNEARRLLGDPTLTIKEVAARLHFSSEFYFSHFFRKASGMSPTQFRSEPRG